MVPQKDVGPVWVGRRRAEQEKHTEYEVRWDEQAARPLAGGKYGPGDQEAELGHYGETETGHSLRPRAAEHREGIGAPWAAAGARTVQRQGGAVGGAEEELEQGEDRAPGGIWPPTEPGKWVCKPPFIFLERRVNQDFGGLGSSL